MSRYQIVNMETRVYPPPLVDGAPPVVPPEEPPAPTRPLPVRRLVALGWYIVHAALLGAAWITLTRGEFDDSTAGPAWLAPVIGCAIAVALWTITLLLRRWAREEKSKV